MWNRPPTNAQIPGQNNGTHETIQQVANPNYFPQQQQPQQLQGHSSAQQQEHTPSQQGSSHQQPATALHQQPQYQPVPLRPNFDSELQLYVGSKQHKDLLDRMAIVKRARFNAHGRLEQKHKVSIFTLSLISLFVVAISLYALTYGAILPLSTKSAITFASIISSIFIIIVGLLESQNNYQVRALQLHKCAMDITDLHQKLQIETSMSRDDLQNYANKYQLAIQACPYNHDDIDYLMAKLAGRRNDDIGWDIMLQVYLTYYIDVYGLSILILSIPPSILFFL